MARIQGDDTIQSAVLKLCDGNPGAVTALIMLANSPMYLLLLDTYGIYGTDIYVLFSDICDRDIRKMKCVLLSVGEGLLSKETLTDAAHRQDYSGKSMIPVNDICELIELECPEQLKD